MPVELPFKYMKLHNQLVPIINKIQIISHFKNLLALLKKSAIVAIILKVSICFLSQLRQQI